MSETQSVASQPAPDTSWFTTARFGLFMHYGLYSIAGRHEWVMSREELDHAHYRRYLDHFNADLFDADQWASHARSAGMRYAVLTTKHHEGFCLWPSKLSDFTVAQTPAAGRDLVREYVEACRSEGLKVGLYYSLIDWHHPSFPVDGFHPDRHRSSPEINRRDISHYRDYLHGQVRELLESYHPDLLWFDFSYPGDAAVANGKGRDDWGSEELVNMISEIAPHIFLNNRLDYPPSVSFLTPEEYSPDAVAVDQLWETARSVNGSWGYAPAYQDWLNARSIIRMLVSSVARGGNLVLNVAPTGRGQLEPRAARLLAEVGEWTALHGDAIYAAGPSDVCSPPGCFVTARDGRIFLHLADWPAEPLAIPGIAGRLRFANFLHDGLEVRFTDADQLDLSIPHRMPIGEPGSVVLWLPRRAPDVLMPVVELDLG